MTVSGLVIVCKTVYDYAFNKSFIKDFATYCYRDMRNLLSWGGERKNEPWWHFKNTWCQCFLVDISNNR